MSKYKFRAWDKINKLMHDVEFIRPEKEVGVIIEDDKPIQVMDWGRVDLMQSTGYLYSKEQELFDKDIIQMTYTTMSTYIESTFEERALIYFDGHTARVGTLGGGTIYFTPLYEYNIIDLDIIGKEYENAELMEPLNPKPPTGDSNPF